MCLSGCGYIRSQDAQHGIIGATFCKDVKAVVVDASAKSPDGKLAVEVHVAVYGSSVNEAAVAEIARAIAALPWAAIVGVL